MRASFQNTHLLTSQSIVHGIVTADPECHKHVVRYLETGTIGFTDGQICATTLNQTDAIEGIFNIN